MVRGDLKNGFTVVEFVILISAVAILVLALVPQDNLGNIHVEAAAQRLEQDLRYTRELALTTNTNHGIEFQTNGNYTVYRGVPSTPALNPLTQQSFSYNLQNNFPRVTIVNLVTTLRVEFDPLGRPIQGSGSTLQVSDGIKTISLNVTPTTGLVRRL